LSSITERALIHAYRAGVLLRRVEECVCGGEIEAEDSWVAIRNAVETHNDSTVHAQWRAWREYA